jgi:hypothetical protein
MLCIVFVRLSSGQKSKYPMHCSRRFLVHTHITGISDSQASPILLCQHHLIKTLPLPKKPAGHVCRYGYGYTWGSSYTDPLKTRTPQVGTGFWWVRVRVHPKVPEGYPCSSLPVVGRGTFGELGPIRKPNVHQLMNIFIRLFSYRNLLAQ